MNSFDCTEKILNDFRKTREFINKSFIKECCKQIIFTSKVFFYH